MVDRRPGSWLPFPQSCRSSEGVADPCQRGTPAAPIVLFSPDLDIEVVCNKRNQCRVFQDDIWVRQADIAAGIGESLGCSSSKE